MMNALMYAFSAILLPAMWFIIARRIGIRITAGIFIYVALFAYFFSRQGATAVDVLASIFQRLYQSIDHFDGLKNIVPQELGTLNSTRVFGRMNRIEALFWFAIASVALGVLSIRANEAELDFHNLNARRRGFILLSRALLLRLY